MFYRCRCPDRALPVSSRREARDAPRAFGQRKRVRHFRPLLPEVPGALLVVIHGEEADLGWMLLVPAE